MGMSRSTAILAACVRTFSLGISTAAGGAAADAGPGAVTVAGVETVALISEGITGLFLILLTAFDLQLMILPVMILADLLIGQWALQVSLQVSLQVALQVAGATALPAV